MRNAFRRGAVLVVAASALMWVGCSSRGTCRGVTTATHAYGGATHAYHSQNAGEWEIVSSAPRVVVRETARPAPGRGYRLAGFTPPPPPALPAACVPAQCVPAACVPAACAPVAADCCPGGVCAVPSANDDCPGGVCGVPSLDDCCPGGACGVPTFTFDPCNPCK